MTGINKERPGPNNEGPVIKSDLIGLGGAVPLKVDVEIESEPYQVLLAAIREDARLTEENGGRTTEGIEGVRKAVENMNKYAMSIFQAQKSS